MRACVHARARARVCMFVCVCVCARARMRVNACVRACVCACVCVYACVRARFLAPGDGEFCEVFSFRSCCGVLVKCGEMWDGLARMVGVLSRTELTPVLVIGFVCWLFNVPATC